MSLTESQLFTIEALNRIEGFAWPIDAKFAAFSATGTYVGFHKLKPSLADTVFDGHYMQGMSMIVPTAHPDWRNSLITREQFDSVDGWVRLSAGLADPRVMIEGKTVDGVDYWRYVRNEVEDEQPEEKQPSIEELYEKYQTSASSLIDAQMQVDYLKKQSEEALAEIKKWHRERGFSVSVIGAYTSEHANGGKNKCTQISGRMYTLDDCFSASMPKIGGCEHIPAHKCSKCGCAFSSYSILNGGHECKKSEPELNITCGRDLRKGDVVITRGTFVTVIDITDLDGNGKLGFKGKSILGDVYLFTDDEWAFIRRP